MHNFFFFHTYRKKLEEGNRRKRCGEEIANRIAAILLYFCFSRSQSHLWLLNRRTYFITSFNRRKGEENTKACSKILSILESSSLIYTSTKYSIFFHFFKRGKYRGCFIPNKNLLLIIS